MPPHSLADRRARAVGRALNVAIVAALLLLTAVLARNFFSGRTQAKAIAPRARLHISGLDWSRAEHTLLLAVRKDCDFSTRSAPFYRRLLHALAGRGDVRLVALVPHDAAEGESYLDALGLRVAEIRQVPVTSLGIRSVPTLALLDREGVVSDVWAGQLTPSREADVMARLRLTDPRPANEWSMDEGELERRAARREPLVVLDLRERADFARAHRPGVKNIPLDELPVRAINELSTSDTIVLSDEDDLRTESAYLTLGNQGFTRVFILRPRPAAQ